MKMCCGRRVPGSTLLLRGSRQAAANRASRATQVRGALFYLPHCHDSEHSISFGWAVTAGVAFMCRRMDLSEGSFDQQAIGLLTTACSI